MLTQEQIEEFFYTIIGELRDENIPILNDFKERFGNFKYSFEIEEEKEEMEDDEDEIEEIEESKNTGSA